MISPCRHSNQGANRSASPQPTTARQRTAAGPRGSESALAEQDTETPGTRSIRRPARRTVVQLSVPEIDWSYAVIERMDPATLKTTLIPFDLGKAGAAARCLAGSRTAARRHGHHLLAGRYSRPHRRTDHLVRLEGEFVHCGTYSVRPGETLALAGGARRRPDAECVSVWLGLYPRIDPRHSSSGAWMKSIHTMMLQMQRGQPGAGGFSGFDCDRIWPGSQPPRQVSATDHPVAADSRQRPHRVCLPPRLPGYRRAFPTFRWRMEISSSFPRCLPLSMRWERSSIRTRSSTGPTQGWSPICNWRAALILTPTASICFSSGPTVR